MLWAYIAYSQGFLIWIADLPREVTWYLARTEHGWGIVFWILILGHFVLPFLALLSKRTKTDGGRLVWVAGWLLVMHYVDMFWLVLPALTDASPAWHWQDVTGLALVGGAATSFGLLRSAGRAALPVNDPHLAESMQYRRSA